TRTPVVRPAVTETTALGAARLAGLAAGLDLDPDDPGDTTTFAPAIPAAEAQERRRRWSRAVERAAAWEEAD
ncbi:MAG: glycerol kinase, partial [Planctomycetota bacterium]